MLEDVIFDLDGTLIDSNEAHVSSWDRAFRTFGKRFSREELHAQIGKGSEVSAYKEIANINELVDVEITADDVNKSKPAGEIFAATFKKLGNPLPEAVIAVGDTPYDVEASGKVGVATIAVLCGGFYESTLAQAGALAIYRDPADLLKNYSTSPLSHRSV